MTRPLCFYFYTEDESALIIRTLHLVCTLVYQHHITVVHNSWHYCVSSLTNWDEALRNFWITSSTKLKQELLIQLKLSISFSHSIPSHSPGRFTFLYVPNLCNLSHLIRPWHASRHTDLKSNLHSPIVTHWHDFSDPTSLGDFSELVPSLHKSRDRVLLVQINFKPSMKTFLVQPFSSYLVNPL